MTRSLLVLTVLGLFCASSRADEAPARNLVSNPSLEDPLAADGLPMGWNGFHSEPAAAYRVAVVESGHTGKRSLLAEGKGNFVVVRANKLPVDRSKRYRATGWLKIEGDANAAADVKFHYYGAAGEYLDQTRVAFIQPRTPGWHQIAVADQLEQFPEAAFIELAVALAGDGKAWFDDLQLTAGEEPRREVVNWLANGDMEELAADRPAGWGFFVAEGGTVKGASDADIHHSGKRSLHLNGTGEWIAAGSAQIRVDRKREYTLRAFVRSRAGEPNVGFAYFENGKYLGQSAGEPQPTGTDWREVSVRSELANHPTATHIAVVCRGVNEVDAWFDDCIVTPDK